MTLAHHPQNAGKAATSSALPSQTDFRPIAARYAPPDRDRVRAAYQDLTEVVAREGLSGAARASMACYERLAHRPEYGLMDYCLALDAFGAQAYEHAAGESAPSSTYFGQAPVRRQQAVQRLTAGATDANSRLIDTNRLIGEVVLAARAEPAPLEPAAAQVTLAPVSAPPDPAPAPAVKASPEPSIKAVPRPAVVAQAEPLNALPVPTKVEPLRSVAPKVPPAPGKALKAVQLAKAAEPKAPKAAKAPPPTVVKARTTRPVKPVAEPPRLTKARTPPAQALPAPKPSRLAAMVDKLKPLGARPTPTPPSPLQKASDRKPAPSQWMSQLETELKGPKPPAKRESRVEVRPEPPRADPPAAPAQTAKTTPAVIVERKEPLAVARTAPEAPVRPLPRPEAQPSFSCRGSLSRGQRMVCEEPSLAAADRRLSAVFNRALDESPNPRALIAEQNRWLAMRDRMAGDYRAVMGLYQDRIAELKRQGD